MGRTHVGVSHILGTADKPCDGHVDLGEEIAPLVLEDGNVEHEDALDPLVVVSSGHGLEASAAVSGGGDLLEIDVSKLGGTAVHGPVEGVAHVLDGGLVTPVRGARAVGGDDVSVARDLGQEARVGGAVCRTGAVAPGDERHGDVGLRLGSVDGVVRERRVGGRPGRVRAGAGSRHTATFRRLASRTAGVIPGLGEVRPEVPKADAEDTARNGVISRLGEVPRRGHKGRLARLERRSRGAEDAEAMVISSSRQSSVNVGGAVMAALVDPAGLTHPVKATTARALEKRKVMVEDICVGTREIQNRLSDCYRLFP